MVTRGARALTASPSPGDPWEQLPSQLSGVSRTAQRFVFRFILRGKVQRRIGVSSGSRLEAWVSRAVWHIQLALNLWGIVQQCNHFSLSPPQPQLLPAAKVHPARCNSAISEKYQSQLVYGCSTVT